MKIVDVETIVVAPPPPAFGGSYWIFVRLTTDSGITGLGEIYGVPFLPDVVKLMVDEIAEKSVIGSSPFDIEKMWREIYSRNFTQRPDGSVVPIISGIETACWDIMGKETGQPVYNLLGGKLRDGCRSYTYIYPNEKLGSEVYSSLDLSIERALVYKEMGFSALKFDPLVNYSAFDPHSPTAETLDYIHKFVGGLRGALGPSVDLLIGTHGQMTPAGAIRFAKVVEEFDPLWLEEPTPPEMPEQMAQVARGTSVPVATGERLVTKYEFARVLENRAAAVLQFAIGRVGGILEAKKIAAMAEPYYVDIAPHLYAGPIEAAANVHLATATPNFLIQESIETMGNFHSAILKKPLKWENGYLYPSDEPGLGVELNDEVVKAHPYTGKDLHLSMTNIEGWHYRKVINKK